MNRIAANHLPGDSGRPLQASSGSRAARSGAGARTIAPRALSVALWPRTLVRHRVSMAQMPLQNG